jgi:hypothetical protein
MLSGGRPRHAHVPTERPQLYRLTGVPAHFRDPRLYAVLNSGSPRTQITARGVRRCRLSRFMKHSG